MCVDRRKGGGGVGVPAVVRLLDFVGGGGYGGAEVKRLIVSILAAVLVCLFSWLCGFDFDKRGFAAVMTAYCTVAAFVLSYICPAWSDE